MTSKLGIHLPALIPRELPQRDAGGGDERCSGVCGVAAAAGAVDGVRWDMVTEARAFIEASSRACNAVPE